MRVGARPTHCTAVTCASCRGNRLLLGPCAVHLGVSISKLLGKNCTFSKGRKQRVWGLTEPTNPKKRYFWKVGSDNHGMAQKSQTNLAAHSPRDAGADCARAGLFGFLCLPWLIADYLGGCLLLYTACANTCVIFCIKIWGAQIVKIQRHKYFVYSIRNT